MLPHQENNHPLIVFDGVCNLCNGFVNLLIHLDKKAVFKFLPLQSGKTGHIAAINKNYVDLAKDLSTVILLEGEKISTKSDAVVRIATYLPWPWFALKYLRFLPKSFRDSIYDFVARNRYRWFGKKNRCMVPSPDVMNRFL